MIKASLDQRSRPTSICSTSSNLGAEEITDQASLDDFSWEVELDVDVLNQRIVLLFSCQVMEF